MFVIGFLICTRGGYGTAPSDALLYREGFAKSAENYAPLILGSRLLYLTGMAVGVVGIVDERRRKKVVQNRQQSVEIVRQFSEEYARTNARISHFTDRALLHPD